MNLGRKNVLDKKEALNSPSAKRKKKAGVSVLRVILYSILAVFTIVICLGIGAYRGIIASAPDISDVNIMPMGYATFVYDANGNQMQRLTYAEGNRVSVSIEDIPENMQHAIVAIEDSRFYEHNGVDPQGMLRAIAVAVSSGLQRTEGASTITQQLLKNNVFTDWTQESTIESIKRKIQEQYLAVKLEKHLAEQGENPKDVILENYLNTVNFGSGAYGVQTAAQTYFGKDCKDLTLSECAVLAAIPQNPTWWNPRNHPENNAVRRETVLDYMLDQGYITQEDHDSALADNVYARIQQHAESQSTEEAPYSYFIDELISQIRKDLMEQKGYTEVQANNAIYSGGLRIYSTQDPSIQQIMDEEFQNEANYPAGTEIGLDWALTVDHADGTRQNYSREMLQLYFREQGDSSFDLLFPSQEEAQSYIDQYKAAVVGEGDTIVAERSSFTPQPQAAMTILDQKTGYVKGIVGGRGQKTASLTLNRATDTYEQPGSTFKILSTYGPALENGKITLATHIEDEPYNYSDGTPLHNSDNTYRGDVTVRTAIINSINVPAVKVLTEITPETGFSVPSAPGLHHPGRELRPDPASGSGRHHQRRQHAGADGGLRGHRQRRDLCGTCVLHEGYRPAGQCASGKYSGGNQSIQGEYLLPADQRHGRRSHRGNRRSLPAGSYDSGGKDRYHHLLHGSGVRRLHALLYGGRLGRLRRQRGTSRGVPLLPSDPLEKRHEPDPRQSAGSGVCAALYRGAGNHLYRIGAAGGQRLLTDYGIF